MMKTLRNLAVSAFALMLAGTAAAGDMIYTYGYCADVEEMNGIGNGQAGIYAAAAMKIPKAKLQEWQMDGVSAVQFCYANGNSNVDATAFISSSLNAAPAYKQTVKAKPGWNECVFDQVQSWDNTKDLYVGWYVKTTGNGHPIACDGTKANPNACFIGLAADAAGLWGAFQDYSANDFGNVMITVVMSGSNFPSNTVSIQDFTTPGTLRPNQPFTSQLTLKNEGANEVNSVTVEYSLGAGATVSNTYNFEGGLKSLGTTTLDIEMETDEDSFNLPLVLTVTAVNDTPVEPAPTYEENLIVSDYSYPYTVVVEEATCLKCGYCVMGYDGMEYMKDNYGNRSNYIGISAHNTAQGSDPMACSAYNGWASKYTQGNPSATINRKYKGDAAYPDRATLENWYKLLSDRATNCKVDVTASIDEDVITATATAVFGVGKQNAKYAVTFVAVEDGLGPYYQTNYLTGGNSGTQFDALPNPCSLMFNDVARDITGWSGISKSIPAQVVAGEEYSYTKKMNNKFDNKDNGYIIALLLDTASGEILNASKVKLTDSGINDVADADYDTYAVAVAGGVDVFGADAAVAYDLAGRMCGKAVNGHIQLPAGVYVISMGQKAVKVLVK